MENHRVEIQNRERIHVTKVTDVDAFDENALWANLQEGGLEMTGRHLSIEKLDLDEGILVVTGQLDSLAYTGNTEKKGRKIPLLSDWLQKK